MKSITIQSFSLEFLRLNKQVRINQLRLRGDEISETVYVKTKKFNVGQTKMFFREINRTAKKQN